MKKVLVSLSLAVMMLLGVVGITTLATDVYAADNGVCDDPTIDPELRKAAGCKVDGDGVFGDKEKTAIPIILNIINVVMTLVGLIAVGVIVYGGITFTTSTGDASKVTKAKHSILYGVVGLVVSTLAFAIVAFVNASILKK